MIKLRETFAVLVLCLVAACSVILLRKADEPSELVQLDGIELDPHAASELSGGSSASSQPEYVQVSHDSSKHMNKLLKQDEKGEIDGIPLDGRAAAELGDTNSEVHIQHLHKDHSRHRKKLRVSKAQALLDQGKEDLDGNDSSDAVQLFSRAEAIWKKQGNEDYHWAQSLKKDVLRAHPELASNTHSTAVITAHQQQIKDAEKQLSSGSAFRSLYGLLRERQAAKIGGDSTSKRRQGSALETDRAESSPATMSSLVQTRPGSSATTLSKSIDAATNQALEKLKAKNKALLLGEEAALLKRAEQTKRAALLRQATRASSAASLSAQSSAQSSSGQLQVWSSSSGVPPSASLQWKSANTGKARYQSLSELPSSPAAPLPLPSASQQQLASPPQAQYQQMAQQPPALYQQLAPARLQHKAAVPVINLNLPPGQTVPPGRYAMDGSLMEDLQGHWDFVGSLLPTSAQEVAE